MIYVADAIVVAAFIIALAILAAAHIIASRGSG